MPTRCAMSQISPRVRILLAVVVVLGLAYFIVLRPHPQSSTTAPPAPAAAATAPAATHAVVTSSSSSANLPPGVGGLVRDVAKAQGAVAESAAGEAKDGAPLSGANAQQAAQAGRIATAGGVSLSTGEPTASASHSAAAGATKLATTTSLTTSVSVSRGAHGVHTTITVRPVRTTVVATHGAKATATAKPKAVPNPLAPALAVETELKQGKTVAVLFWDPAGSDDQAVHSALESLVKRHGSLVVHLATADQAADYGTITSAEQVLETPTILLMRGKSVEQITDLQSTTDLRTYIAQIDAGGANVAEVPSFTSLDSGSTRAQYVVRVNKMCTSAGYKVYTFDGDAQHDVSQFEQLINRDVTIVNRIAALGPPAADRAYINSIKHSNRDGIHDLVLAVTDTAKGNLAQARADELGAQTNADNVQAMLANYGLVACVPPTAR